jgi:hypothetical protein
MTTNIKPLFWKVVGTLRLEEGTCGFTCGVNELHGKYGIYFKSLRFQGLPYLSAMIFTHAYQSCASVTRCHSHLSEPWAHIPQKTANAI